MNWLDSLRSRLFGSTESSRALMLRARRKNPSRRLTLEYLENRLAPSVSMVTDIYSYTNSSFPQNLTDVNGRLFFTATDNTGTIELFKTDGTAAGTAELTTGTRLSSFGGLVNLGGKLFFTASDAVLAYTGLFVSDGTVVGTQHFTAGGQNVLVFVGTGNQVLAGSKLYFEAFDQASGKNDLWISNGTSAGTHPVQPGTTTEPTGSALVNFTNVNGKLFFQSFDNSTNKYTLWKSDGTAAGTVLVTELSAYQPFNFTAVGSTLYFEEYDSAHSLYALWKSDGTGAGTVQVADIGASATQFYSLTAFGTKLFFQVADSVDAPNTGYALWVSDGTAAGTGAFKFNGGTTAVQTNSNTPEIVFNSALYFQGYDTTNSYSLWKTDGISANNNTATVQTTGASPFNSNPSLVTVVGAELFFKAFDFSNGLYDLWKTDGTSAGTAPVQSGALVALNISNLVASNGKAFFSASDVDVNGQSPHGTELWSSDGTAANTAMVTDINTTTPGSNPYGLTALGNEIFFQAVDNSGSLYLYQSDGTAAGTVRVQSSTYGFPGAVNFLTAVNNTLFFVGNGPDGYELWSSGTAPNSASPFQHGGAQEIAGAPFDLINDNGLLYFFAFDSANVKYALWKSDGTQAGTVPLVDLPSPTGLGQLTVVGSNLFFQEFDSTNNAYALWEYNGTSASQVMDIGANSITFGTMTAVGSSVFFQALDSSVSQNALWTSNGTTTTLLTHFASGGLGGQIAFNGKLFYDAADPSNGDYALWMSDGTVAGTQLYLTSSGTPVAMPSAFPFFTIVGTNLYFKDFDLGTRYLLAKTDGTPGGYATVQATSTGTIASNINWLANDNGILVFEGYDPAHGYELWQSDGTANGTLLTADIVPGPSSSNPQYLTVAGTQVFFNANDGFHGTELWAATITSSTVVTAGLSGPSDGVTEQHRAFVLTANDSNSGNNSAGFSFAINWGDGTSQTVIGQSGITTDHQYGATGSFIISVTATNLADNVTSVAFTQTETITQTEVQGGNLALGGVAGNDAFLITPGTTAGTYTVKVNGSPIITNFKPATGQQIFLYGGNGTTTITVTDSGTTADAFTLGAGYVTFKGFTFVILSPASWTVNGNNGADTFTIAGAASASIAGGSGKNTYKFVTGGSLTGTLSGGSGTMNTLDYSGYATSGVVVDLPLGSATAVFGGASGGISGIRNVTGSKNGGDILVGDANPNVLKALKGHNILIGGSGGGDTLTSGGADILIAGTTSYDSNIAALQTILATWQTSTPANYATVVATISSNAFADPLNNTTVFDSGSPDLADTLNGKGGASPVDWFFAHNTGGTKPNDTINGLVAGETVTSI